MNIAHPFREGNGRSTRIWLDLILKSEIQKVVDWNLIDKSDYLSAMERSPINDLEISYLISNALTDKISDRELYMKGIDVSYFMKVILNIRLMIYKRRERFVNKQKRLILTKTAKSGVFIHETIF